MIHQRSIVHYIFPVYGQVREINFTTKSCLISENKPKNNLKMSIWFTKIKHESSELTCALFFSS